MVEYGIMHAGLGQWIGVSGDGVLGLMRGDPVSLRISFPDDPDAGSLQFAKRLLDAMQKGALPEGIRLELSANGVADCALVKVNIGIGFDDRRELDFQEHATTAVCFDVIGPDERVDFWIESYLARFGGERFSASAVTVDENSGFKTTRVWRKKTPTLN